LETGINLVVGLPGAGKTSYMSAKLKAEIYNEERIEIAENVIQMKRDGGFPYTMPSHNTYTNFDLVAEKWRYNARKAWDIEPQRLAIADDTIVNPATGQWYFQPHFLPPYSVIGITEAHEHFHAHDWQKILPCRRRFFERHRHNGYLIYMDVQEYDSIAKGIRVLAKVTEVQSFESVKNALGNVIGSRWVVRKFANTKVYDAYLSSGQTLKNYTEEVFEVDYDIHQVYDSHGCEPDFYEGHINDDFDRELVFPPEQTVASYVQYFNQRRLYA